MTAKDESRRQNCSDSNVDPVWHRAQSDTTDGCVSCRGKSRPNISIPNPFRGLNQGCDVNNYLRPARAAVLHTSLEPSPPGTEPATHGRPMMSDMMPVLRLHSSHISGVRSDRKMFGWVCE